MLRRLLLAVLVPPLAAGALAAQAASRQGERPPIIDRELFFGDPELSGAQISPDGRFISFRKQYQGVMNLWVKRTEEPFEAARPLTADTARPVRGYFWSQDGRYVLYVQDKGGNEDFHVYAVDPAAGPEAATGVPPARDLTPYENVQARIYDVPRAMPGTIIVGLNDRDPQLHDVYRIDLETGNRELIFKNTENVVGWITDLKGNVRLGVRLGSDGGTQVLRVDGERLVQVYDCSNEETCSPIRYHKDGRRTYLITNKGAAVDLIRLVLFDPATGAEEFVEADPENQVDFAGAWFSDVTDEILATVYLGDRVRIYPKTEQARKDLELLRSKLPEGEIGFGSTTRDERRMIVSISRDVDPGSTYLYDRDRGEVQLLYRSRPNLPTQHLAPMQAIRYKARDGLEVPAYLTLPKGVAAKNLPVVINPHGGPWARDLWGYDSYAQYLANRGYAVLQPNFRGSTGYGKKFLNAGNKEWGTGAMQHDITDGVRHLIQRGIADPKRVGIYGGSYGGYATLAGLAFTPDVYAAGVSLVGPSSIITLLNSIPPYWEPIKRIFHVRVGDPDDPKDRERLVAQSPLHSADKIAAPLLVIQGANDPRVKKAESEQIVVAIRERGRPVEYMLAPDEGHGFAGRENRLAVAVAIERFFAKHLGGRYQESMPDEISAKLAALTVDVRTVTLAEAPAGAEAAATVPLPVSDGTALRAGTMEYRTTLQVMGRDLTLTTTRTLGSVTENGRTVWRVVDATQTPMGTSADTLWMEGASLAPIRRSAMGAGSLKLQYTKEAVTGEIRAGPQTMPVNATLEAPVFSDGSNVEMVLAGLPLAQGYSTTFRVFNAQMQRVRPLKLAVTGTATVECSAGTFETLVVEITPLDDDEAGTATLNVMRAKPHYVVRGTTKLPAMMGGGSAATELVSAGSGK